MSVEMQRYYTTPVNTLSPQDFTSLLKLAMEEDCPEDDITSYAIFSPEDRGIAHLTTREDGILCGSPILEAIHEIFGDDFIIKMEIQEGSKIQKGSKIAEISGSLRVILRMERIFLNFLQYLSGIATTVNKIVNEFPDLLILDTRKTLPGYRKLAKYAVYTGGGANHRLNLSDMALIKDNHIALCGSITNAVEKIRSNYPDKKIELEIDTLEELEEAIKTSPEIIMLDNFNEENTKIAIENIRSKSNIIRIECSGGITPNKLKFLAGFGGIGVSMGYITHTTRFMDLGLDIEY
jgi:nicotinate-nucleotide pyrophosphorylase (carboxylating)